MESMEWLGPFATFYGCAGLLALVLVLLAWHQLNRRRKRVTALYAWARSYGWTYLQADPTVVRRFRGEPFGGALQAFHVLSGPHRGRQVLAFEYRLASNSGEVSTSPQFTVVTVAIPVARPYLQVSREGAGRKLRELVGVRDLQLESEEFNRVFQVSARDEKFAYDVLHPRMMEWLLADQRARSTPFRLEGNSLLCWRAGRLDPRNVLWMADYLVDVLERVPAFVWK